MPFVKVYKNDQVVGSAHQVCCPAYLCKFEVAIFMGPDANEVTKHMTIKKCAINCHTCCSVPLCGLCGKEMLFEILGKDGNVRNDVALKKVHNGCCIECFSCGDKYTFILPSDPDEAAVFIAAIQLIDMLYFENPWSCSG
jgi:hypothetical protein